MLLPLIWLGELWTGDELWTERADTVLKRHGLKPVELQPKDGLSLINGTQLVCAYGAYVVEKSFHLLRVFENLEQVLGIELFTAAQALDFRKPLRPGLGVEIAHNYIREQIPHAVRDQYFRDDMSNTVDLVRSSDIPDLIAGEEIALK